MAKEWILNQSLNRWGLNKKKSVGPVSELIRICSPRTVDEWKQYYFRNVFPETYLEELGKKLYTKITEVIQFEVAEVTEADCIAYVKELVLHRTFAGYQTEIQTIYGQVQQLVGVPIQPASDEWDRLFNVDFTIEVSGRYLGIQIKPVTFEHTFEDHKWKAMQERTHAKFTDRYGGKVITIFSVKEGDRKIIQNPEVIEQIKSEIARMRTLPSS